MNEIFRNISFNKGFIRTKSHAKFLLKNGYTPDRLLLHYNMNFKVLTFVLAKKILLLENKN